MDKTCCMCQQSFTEGGKSFVLEGEDEKVVGDDEVSYCSACIKVIEDPEMGAQFLKGSYEMHLREIGVPSSMAHTMAQRFYMFLKSKANAKAH